MDKRIYDNLSGVQQNYIAPFLWLHNEDDELIISELERIYESGIRSVCIESRTHEEFCREDWWADVRLIFDKCKELGMNVWILDDKHFPTGYANGIFEEKYKHLQPFGICEQHIDVVGPVKDGAADAIVNIFAPCAEEEYTRILSDGGYIFVVGAGKDHLMGLKRAIYDDVYENGERADMPRELEHIERIVSKHSIVVEGEENIAALFSMTPYYWRTSEADKEKLLALRTLETEIEFEINVYKK